MILSPCYLSPIVLSWNALNTHNCSEALLASLQFPEQALFTPPTEQVQADLTPISKSEVAVQFKTFKILGLFPVKAPESAKGRLDTTYLDEDLRISRGDRGAFFSPLLIWMLDTYVGPVDQYRRQGCVLF